jgi:hypothetical protein
VVVAVLGHRHNDRQELTEQVRIAATGSLIGGSAQLSDTNQLSSCGSTSFNGGINMAESGKPVVDGGLSYVTRGWATGMVPINSTVGLSPAGSCLSHVQTHVSDQALCFLAYVQEFS